MTQEWKELKTLQEVAAAQAAGEEIQACVGGWYLWSGESWSSLVSYRSRPKKQTKTIVLREALLRFMGRAYFTRWSSDLCIGQGEEFIQWLDTPAREIKVEV